MALGGYRARASASSLCNPSSLLAACALVCCTFICTRLLDQYLDDECVSSRGLVPSRVERPSGRRYRSYGTLQDVFGAGRSWPDEGYGSQLSLHIYVYEEHEVPGLSELLSGRDHSISAESCVKTQWGMQVKIHQFLLQSKFRTFNKNEAQLFFVPSYVKCVRMKGGLDDKEINQTYVKILQHLPYFRRSGGRDHVFVFPSGIGAHLFKGWATFLNRSVFLTPEGDRTDKRDTSAFNTWKDIIIPGNVDDAISLASSSSLEDVIQPLPLGRRKYLANFLGRAQGKAGRLKILELAKKFPEQLDAPKLDLTGSGKFGRREYFQRLRNAKFCLAPRGESSWTLRLFEAFFVECVPVILSDQIELPFQNVLNYSGFSIKWPATHMEELLYYLDSISDREIEMMLGRGRSVRCLWLYIPEAEGCSAMTGILWELQRKVRLFHQSTETFWLHNGSFVNRDLKPMQQWLPPLPIP